MFPRLVQLGMLTIPTRGACIALGLMLALLLTVRTARLLALDVDRVWNLSFLAVFSFIAGGRVVLLLTHWRDYAAYPSLLLVVSIHTPALLIGSTAIAFAACAISLWMHPLPVLRTLDALAPPLVLGYAFACIGAFAGGADYGSPTSVPWAVRFHSRYALLWSGTPQDVPLHPVQLYQSAFELLLCGLLLWLLNKHHRDGEICGAWLFLGGVGHFVLEFYRGGRSTEFLDATQIVALLMIVAGAILWMDRNNEAARDEEKNAI
ncbi:MAG TPA: prolipoprotein diacylglyceryl transferase family protein [Acidobacteriaceae bacterium]|jgi:phosphatidylglycerol:prolipoprotein diacylglycerol transferase|nr:prolipoprotein diacylglyceryl transferase family protein [Acidobacteriaceae bacterium]